VQGFLFFPPLVELLFSYNKVTKRTSVFVLLTGIVLAQKGHLTYIHGMASDPVYSLDNFKIKGDTELCYVNRLSKHLESHKFVNSPHRHDFYLIVFFTTGSGTHTIDFVNYPVKPNSVFVMQPGQLHNWKLSKSAEGFVCFHSREFYEEFENSHLLNELSFYRAINRVPYIGIPGKSTEVLSRHFRELLEEYKSTLEFRNQKLRVYLNSIYLDIARLYGPDIAGESNKYLLHLRDFQNLVEQQFVDNRSPERYASQLKLTV
jgi:AraC family transcriptional regulator, transcriptional activator of pobA